MNAILGITRPGDFGVDMMHYNVHKTFTGPHGAAVRDQGPSRSASGLLPTFRGPWSSRRMIVFGSITMPPRASAGYAASSATLGSWYVATATFVHSERRDYAKSAKNAGD